MAAVARRCLLPVLSCAVPSPPATACQPLLLLETSCDSARLNFAATKFIGGHSDVTAGILAVRDTQLADRLYFLQVRLH